MDPDYCPFCCDNPDHCHCGAVDHNDGDDPMTNPTTPFDRALAEFTRDMKWSPERTEMEKTLVLGNLNGFVALLNKKLLETSDAEILAAVSAEDLAEGHRIKNEALRR